MTRFSQVAMRAGKTLELMSIQDEEQTWQSVERRLQSCGAHLAPVKAGAPACAQCGTALQIYCPRCRDAIKPGTGQRAGQGA